MQNLGEKLLKNEAALLYTVWSLCCFTRWWSCWHCKRLNIGPTASQINVKRTEAANPESIGVHMIFPPGLLPSAVYLFQQTGKLGPKPGAYIQSGKRTGGSQTVISCSTVPTFVLAVHCFPLVIQKIQPGMWPKTCNVSKVKRTAGTLSRPIRGRTE